MKLKYVNYLDSLYHDIINKHFLPFFYPHHILKATTPSLLLPTSRPKMYLEYKLRMLIIPSNHMNSHLSRSSDLRSLKPSSNIDNSSFWILFWAKFKGSYSVSQLTPRKMFKFCKSIWRRLAEIWEILEIS